MYLFLFLLLLRVCELDDDGGGAALHGLRVVHRLDRSDRSLPRRERHESTACRVGKCLIEPAVTRHEESNGLSTCSEEGAHVTTLGFFNRLLK